MIDCISVMSACGENGSAVNFFQKNREFFLVLARLKYI